MFSKKMTAILIPAIVLTQTMSGMTHAGFITNGNFAENSALAQVGYNDANGNMTTLTGWSSVGYNLIFQSGTADTTGSYVGQYGHYDTLWGPSSSGGNANGLDAPIPGGNTYFIGSDGAGDTGPLTQTMQNLVAGKTYTVGFYWAGAQQYGYSGATTEAWEVGFGNSTQTTVTLNNVNHGFTGWYYQTFNFVAQTSNDVLSFLAIGTPASGEPPFSLLEGVTVTQAVPEPATVLLVGLGLFGFGIARMRRRGQKASA
jgi:hypothetical protein